HLKPCFILYAVICPQGCKEKTVCAMACGRKAQHWSLHRRRAAQQFSPKFGQGDQAEVFMAGEEGLNLLLVFLPQKRAGRIDQAAARAQQTGGALQNRRLKCDEFVQPIRAEAPARFGISAPGTAARSEEHTSELQSRENLVCRLLLEKKN